MNSSIRGFRNGLVIVVLSILLCSIFAIIPASAQYNYQNNENTSTTRSDEGEAAKFTEEIDDYGIDTNENELFDYLIINIKVQVIEPGTYELGSKLMLKENYPIIYVFKEFETEQEFIELQVKFEGEPIFDSGISGSYLCVLWLDDQYNETIDELDYRTSEYDFSKFEHPPQPIILFDNSTDRENDTNRNGLYEYLDIRINMEVVEPGYYSILCGLFKKMEYDDREKEEKTFYFRITFAQKIIKLDQRAHYLKLRFKGPDIRLNELDGPYFIGLWIEQSDPEAKDTEEMTPEERKQFQERLKHRLQWPMVGEGDLSGEIVYKTKVYDYLDFEEPPKQITFTKRVKDYPVDQNDNGLYDFLRLSVGVNVSRPGDYLVYAELITDSNWFQPAAENFTFLNKGLQNIILNFKGEDIHKSQLDGLYAFSIMIKAESPEGYDIFERMKYEAPEKYSHKDFEPGQKAEEPIEVKDDSRPYAKLDLEGITTKTDIIEVYTARSRPEITFWYADSEDSGARFRLIFQRVIGYKDQNDNGRFDFGEERFEVFLEDSLWSIEGLTYSMNSEYGNYVEFKLSSDLALYNIKRPPPEKEPRELNRLNLAPDWAKLEFTFLITSHDFTLTEPLAYKINGGTELKIDIQLTIYQHVDIDGICLEQILFDEANIHGFKTNEANRNWVYHPDENPEIKGDIDTGPLNLFEPKIDSNKQQIMFIDKSEKEFGFYSWVDKINVTYIDGSSEIISIDTTYIADRNGLRLFTSYPYSNEIETLHHDPSIGMIKENKPKISKSMDDFTKILFNPLIYITACVIAIIFLGLIRRNQMRHKRDTKSISDKKEIRQLEKRRRMGRLKE